MAANWVVRTAKIALVVVAGLAAAETSFRTVFFPAWKSLSEETFIRHPVYGHINKPNLEVRRYSPPNYDVVNRTNSLGFRDREAGFADDLAGLWVAGGSNTFAGGVEDDRIYPSLLQQQGFAAANLASEGHTIVQQALVIRSLAAQGYRPKGILIELSLNGVLADRRDQLQMFDRPLSTAEVPANVIEGARARDALRGTLNSLATRLDIDFTAVKQRLIRHSAIYGWLKVGVNDIPALRAAALRLGLRADASLSGYGTIDFYRVGYGNPTDIRIESTADFLARLDEWTRVQLAAPLFALVIPPQHDIYPERLEALARHLKIDPAELDADRPRRMLVDALRQRGIRTLDLGPVLRSSGRPDLIFPDDAHLSAPAHAIVATAVVDWLREGQAIPSR